MQIGNKFFWALLLVFIAVPLSAETWYIRPDGGTRHSAKTSGQCDGKADAPYRGKGTNQHCAFNDYRYLWDDHSYGNSAWVIAGGDTVIIRGGPWRVGFNQANANDVWCSGGNGNGACMNPKIPAGTPTQHTRILGENYASCSSGGVTDRSKLTQIFGGFGVWVDAESRRRSVRRRAVSRDHQPFSVCRSWRSGTSTRLSYRLSSRRL